MSLFRNRPRQRRPSSYFVHVPYADRWVDSPRCACGDMKPVGTRRCAKCEANLNAPKK